MDMARKHRVHVESQFMTLVIGITVLEGIGRQVPPLPCLLILTPISSQVPMHHPSSEHLALSRMPIAKRAFFSTGIRRSV